MGDEYIWPAPKGNTCSIFLDVDLVFFFSRIFFFFGGGGSMLSCIKSSSVEGSTFGSCKHGVKTKGKTKEDTGDFESAWTYSQTSDCKSIPKRHNYSVWIGRSILCSISMSRPPVTLGCIFMVCGN